MAEPGQRRKLEAILSADVVGYSRLMQDDDAATVETLTKYRTIFSDFVNRHEGRIVDSPGDNILAEFDSPVEAVQCAVEIQRELGRHNLQLAAHRQMQFRIGINLGDVIAKQDGTIYGDGVNIAARLEGLAEPGGICLSETVFLQTEGKTEAAFEDIGAHEVKNIAKPVRTYRVVTDLSAAPVKPTAGRKARLEVVAAVVGVVLVVAGIAFWWGKAPPSTPLPNIAMQPEDSILTLPDKPSIAVLPFVNMSGDPEQEYFSDGISETIITDLSKLSNLFVIARNSTFRYKGQAVDVRDVGRELGVRYVLEGSIQKARSRVRINVQLVDASTGEHLWAERYDRPFDDLFALQDEITQKIVTELDVNLVEGEQARMWRRISDETGSYEITMKAIESFRKGTREGNEEARRIFNSILDNNPDAAAAIAGVGWAHMNDFRFGWSSDPRQSMARAIELANRSLSIDDNVAVAHALLGFLRLYQGRHDDSLASMRKATSLQPNSSLFSAIHANALIYAGMPEESLVAIERAMRLSPFYPSWYLSVMSLAYHDAGRFEDSIAANEKYIKRQQEGLQHLAYLVLSLAYSGLGQEQKAREAAQEVIRRKPDFALENLPRVYPYRDPAKFEGMIRKLRSAGLN